MVSLYDSARTFFQDQHALWGIPPHRYHESTLRMLQMRRDFVWAEGGPWLINPPLPHYLALELGRNAQTAPDAWGCLRESVVKGGKNG